MSSPVFVGRRDELDALDTALTRARAEVPSTVLIGGEAGVGKSRLVREFAARAGDACVLVGGCLELGVEGLPFAPFTAALRQLVRHYGVDDIAALLPGGPGELARLLPEFGTPPAEADEARARLFEQVLMLIERVAEWRPLVLVIEDAHWSDGSTRDLLVFLVRNLASTPVQLVVTYRSDELHRTHALRPLLAELGRLEGVTRLELHGLTRREVAQQTAAIRGRDADPSLVEDVFARSSGNPLFVESLLSCAGAAYGGMPDSLRDLLLAAVTRLPEETQQVLHAAAAGGTRVGHGLLAAVTGFDDGSLSAALRPAVNANVLVTDGDEYAFRHALIREAVHDELLPGEHARLHTRFAEAMERDPSLVPGRRLATELAHQWYAAHDNGRALWAAWRAAREARTVSAFAEQLRMLERVLELWDRVPEAAEWLGADRSGVLEFAVDAAHAMGEAERGVAYATQALRELDADRHPRRAASLLTRRGRIRRFEFGQEAGLHDMHEAERLFAADPDSPGRAWTLASLSQALFLEPSYEEAQPLGEEALEIARRIGDSYTEAHVLTTLACMRANFGDLEAARAMQAEAMAIAARIGQPMLAWRIHVNESDALEGAGEHEQAAVVARRGLAEARDAGLARTSGAFLTSNLAESLVSLGRWDEASEVLPQAIELAPPPVYSGHLHMMLARVALARGHLDAAETALADARASFAGHAYTSAQQHLPLTRLEVELDSARGRADAVLGRLECVLAGHDPLRSPRYAWPLLAAGASACAELAAVPSRRDERALGRVRDVLSTLRTRAEDLSSRWPVERAHRATFYAELGRADAVVSGAGSSPERNLAAWDSAVQEWDATTQPYPCAIALLRAAQAAAELGARDVAAARLTRCHRLAEALDAAPLRQQVEALARRARLRLGASSDRGSEGSPDREQDPGRGERRNRLGLTERELEVLRLVAAGRSNRQIAEELFISAKTASVHVSNILVKLGAASRGEAAATASRLRLFEGLDSEAA